jgi:hypothetical protein
MTRTGDLMPLTDKDNWLYSMLGLTLKNFNNGSKNKNKTIAALTLNKTTTKVDFEAINVDYIPLDDSQFSKKFEDFLTQIQ